MGMKVPDLIKNIKKGEPKMTFFNIIESIKTPEIHAMAMAMIPIVPKYFWDRPASTSGKHHPEFDLGVGGVRHHSVMVARCVDALCLAEDLPQEERDALIFAALYHDSVKEGWNGPDHTVHEHPLLAAELIRKTFPNNKWAEFAAHCIESHMGKWTTSKYSNVILPKPEDKWQKILSHADMIASRQWWKVDDNFWEVE